ncbi:Tyrosine recombinase XerC [Gemmata obscuriglobus]|uniref:Site-specific integrase n=1 Tax=Gemmata obscuriglobus TaxID=114 RepID=A0A2Z3GRB1_9BACT|nr:site-specific integrase [Gemmata obscuriglobus]AWM35848.1 site-specific integrase [Gemmata obscuriglobus]QEG31610.1 Tyrosine recombinase XerC [Gemmata obscuriglobus]VTS10952.1 integrase-recombinase protein : Site-specific recombinase XerD OS=Singulisphaera acidiphila (strain ATCC BAA-1392 / DSM 18658 / VKM B-2454 / MOB10) GN=Sinac_4560 PE=4 SV=1: Phage_integrase [Gemmata obscuriglobus UQM 2246]
MGRVHRKQYTKPIPAGAERVTVKGVPCVRWRGKSKQWQVGVVLPGGRCRLESANWYVTYFDHTKGKEVTVPGYADKAASEALLAQLVRTSARVDAGLLPPEAVRPRLSLTELLDRWHRHVKHGGASDEGARRQRRHAQAVCDGVSAAKPADLTPSAVLEWIEAQRESGGRSGDGISVGTAANYIGAAKSFTRWCCVVEKCEPVDHLSGLEKSGPGPDDRVHVRRSLLPDDLDKLLAAARASTAEVYGLTGPERHALYLTACSTGLRASELARLKPEHFDLVGATVTVHRPAKTKKRATDVLPLGPDVVEALRPILAAVGKGTVWPNRGAESQAWWLLGARLIRADLVAAGIPPTAPDGRVYDFHSLRGQFATDLDRAGVSLPRAQKLMRHSTPDLTAKHYHRPESDELAADVAKLRRGKPAGS